MPTVDYFNVPELPLLRALDFAERGERNRPQSVTLERIVNVFGPFLLLSFKLGFCPSALFRVGLRLKEVLIHTASSK